jgi:hypothetical protein
MEWMMDTLINEWLEWIDRLMDGAKEVGMDGWMDIHID